MLAGFLKFLVEYYIDEMGVDASRIYVTGHSNGCAMAQRFAAEASQVVAAAGCHAFYLLTNFSKNYVTVPFIEVHGLEDDVVSYTKAYTVPPFGYVDGQNAMDNLKMWAKANKCKGEPTLNASKVTGPTGKQNVSVLTYERCQGGTEVALVTLSPCGHLPFLVNPSVPYLAAMQAQYNTTAQVWDFMKRYSRDERDGKDGKDGKEGKESKQGKSWKGGKKSKSSKKGKKASRDGKKSKQGKSKRDFQMDPRKMAQIGGQF
eukprot:g10644.t1